MQTKTSAFFSQNLTKLTVFATLLALAVIMLGAYTRLSDSGLGCPDWPGCYGRLIAPLDTADTMLISAKFPKQKIEPGKAWIEMIHRYLAGSFGLLILLLAGGIFYNSETTAKFLITLLIVAVLGQALLGKWTVTMKLYPIVVLAHLLGGMTILTLSWLLTLSIFTTRNILTNEPTAPTPLTKRATAVLRTVAGITLLSLILQIALGGWTSANYAAVVCSDFPSCQGNLWPPMNWRAAFNFTAVGIFDSPGIALENSARVTIQMAHRLGALLATIAISLLCIMSYGFANKLAHWHPNKLAQEHTTQQIANAKGKLLKTASLAAGGLLIVQIMLGISNVLAELPIVIAVLHNGIAACLLLAVVTIIYTSFAVSTTNKSGLSSHKKVC